MKKEFFGKRAKMHRALSLFIRAPNKKRVNGNVSSFETRKNREKILHTCFNDLYDLDFKIKNPINLKPRHVETLCQYWYYKKNLALTTIVNRLSVLRIFSRWINKAGMVKPLFLYLPNIPKAKLKIYKAAVESKSWFANGINIFEKFEMAKELDLRFYLMLHMALAFGLRKKEAIGLRPHEADRGEYLHLTFTKNGRVRDVLIRTAEQRVLLDLVKKTIPQGEHLGWIKTKKNTNATLKYSIRRYEKCMREIGITKDNAGVTGHGLRAQYAENEMLMLGYIPPTLSGRRIVENNKLARYILSQQTGHNRIEVTCAYCGTYWWPKYAEKADEKLLLTKALHYCASPPEKVTPERLQTCQTLIEEMRSIGVDATLSQAEYLWSWYGQRHGHAWLAPHNKNIAALTAIAIALVDQK